MDEVLVEMCGPSNVTCKCECGRGGPCEHQWDGPERLFDGGGEVTCSRCCMGAMTHSIWTGP